MLLTVVACLTSAWRPGGAPLPQARVARATGPLRVLAANPRYFTDGSGRAILLTGSHTWLNFQDSGPTTPLTDAFDYSTYLRFLESHNHNFFRLWTWESGDWAPWRTGDFWFEPTPYVRTGPGTALDGQPKYDLTRFHPVYLRRLRSRVREAGDRGIYVSVMLFNGFSVEDKNAKGANPWRGHSFNRANNVNGVDGDPLHRGDGGGTHSLQFPAITALQEAHVRQVVDAVNDLDNVLYEISNESNAASREWQYRMIGYVRRYEAAKPKQHPVGMTVAYPGGSNSDLFASPADWVSPNDTGGYLQQPPAGDGRKVVFTDTDHLCGTCAPAGWVWKSFLRGLNPIFMDPYDRGDEVQGYDTHDPAWEQVRVDMGSALSYANRVPLATMTPQGSLASSGYCLASSGPPHSPYLVYLPHAGR